MTRLSDEALAYTRKLAEEGEWVEWREALALVEEVSETRALVKELVKALEEMRDASAACFRVIAGNRDNNAAIFDELEDEFAKAGIKDGFGKRTDDLLSRARKGRKE